MSKKFEISNPYQKFPSEDEDDISEKIQNMIDLEEDLELGETEVRKSSNSDFNFEEMSQNKQPESNNQLLILNQQHKISDLGFESKTEDNPLQESIEKSDYQLDKNANMFDDYESDNDKSEEEESDESMDALDSQIQIINQSDHSGVFQSEKYDMKNNLNQRLTIKKEVILSKKDKNKGLIRKLFFSNTISHESFFPNIILSFIWGTVMLIISGYMLVNFLNMKNININYSDYCEGSYKVCRIPISLTDTMKSPVFFFISIKGMNQIAFPFKRSFSEDQLKNGSYNATDTTSFEDDCEYSLTNEDVEDVYNIELKSLDPDYLAFPCGLLTKNFPQDTFESIEDSKGNIYELSLLDIWDGIDKYQYINSDQYASQWLDIEDPRFFNWMKQSGSTSATKLWARFNSDLEAGNYFVLIQVAQENDLFSGGKQITITGNVNYFATQNYLLAIIILVLAIMMYGLGITFLVFYFKKHRNDGKNFQIIQQITITQFECIDSKYSTNHSHQRLCKC